MAPLTAVALSGGVDSLVTAFLLRRQGHRLVGIHFTHAYQHPPGPDDPTAAEDRLSRQAPILDMGRQLGIPIEILDCADPFQRKVVDYFVDTYQKGLTPNPCAVCNPAIKFGTVLAHARKLGASRLATGHYARIVRDETGRCHLHKGADTEKEQSYFLAFLSRDQLGAACFPLGDRTKVSVIRTARENELRPAAKGESQDVCFIRRGTYGAFIARQPGFSARPGPIQDIAGNTLGRHRGLHRFTVGQRRGIDCPAAEPYYVVRLDTDRNRLVVGF